MSTMELLIENNENISLYEYLNLNDFPYKERLFMNKHLRDYNFKNESITRDVDYERLNFHDVLSPKIEKLFDKFHFTVDAINELANVAYSIYESVVINKNLLDFDESYINNDNFYFDDDDDEKFEPLKFYLSKDNERVMTFNILDECHKHITFSTYDRSSWLIRLEEDDRPGFVLSSSKNGFITNLLDTDGNPIGLRFSYNNNKREIKLESTDRNSRHEVLIDKDRFVGSFYLPLYFDYHVSDEWVTQIEETPVERIHKIINEVDNQYDDIQTIISNRLGQWSLKQIDKVLDEDIIEVVKTRNDKEKIIEIFNPKEAGKFAYNYKDDFYIYSAKTPVGLLTFYFKIITNTRLKTAALKVVERVIDRKGKALKHIFPLSLSDVPKC